MSIGKAIAKIRQDKGWSQSELARRLGVSPQTVQKWEAGGAPRTRRLNSIAAALGITVSQLLEVADQISGEVSLTDVTSTRRQKLRIWFSANPIPKEEKSYLSQLLSGKASFGERAARRLESEYGMPAGYLDDGAEAPDTESLLLPGRAQRILNVIARLPDVSLEKLAIVEGVLGLREPTQSAS